MREGSRSVFEKEAEEKSYRDCTKKQRCEVYPRKISRRHQEEKEEIRSLGWTLMMKNIIDSFPETSSI